MENALQMVTDLKRVQSGMERSIHFVHFRIDIPKREKDRISNSSTTPLRSPTMAGGLFSIDREFYYDVGTYDEGMTIWGSENLEMSFRVRSLLLSVTIEMS